jgi:hypothetical protein
MIFPADVVPPTAKQWLVSGHATPYSVLVVGEVSVLQVVARAAGAASSAHAATAAANKILI